MNENMTYYQKPDLEFLANVVRQTDDLYLVHCGHQICPSGYTYQHKNKNDFHLHFIMNGKGIFHINGKKYQLQKDDIFILPPDSDFYYAADEEKPWQYFWVTFNGAIAAKNLELIGLSAQNPTIRSTVSVKHYFPYITEILSHHELTRSNDLRRIGILYKLLAELMSACNRHPSEGYQYPGESYYHYALNYINAKYAEVSVSDVAKYIGITSRYLANIFKEMSNSSPKQYITERRMKKAEELITTTEIPMKEIAKIVGYEDPLSFSKSYKAYAGISPLKHRNACIQAENKAAKE